MLRSIVLPDPALMQVPSPKADRAVHVLCDSVSLVRETTALLEPWFSVSSSLIQDGPPDARGGINILVVADLNSVSTLAGLKSMQADIGRFKSRLFVVEANARRLFAQAYALGATGVLGTPVTGRKIVDAFSVDDEGSAESRAAAGQGAAALAQMFSAVRAGSALDTMGARTAASIMATTIKNHSLTTWFNAVRSHHEGTYQHCLLVTGVAVDFGVSLGVQQADLERLCFAAMFHDVGKATIPTAILDKPGKLDAEERRIIETHPGAGYDILKSEPGMTPEILSAVKHHHEFLDGSGYPDRLSGRDIPDLIRLLTISDIFAALIECRSYRPPMPREKAYEILCSMKGKLEWPLVSAFRTTALAS
jgi:putative nucleotidyltransferase with HDIG domain